MNAGWNPGLLLEDDLSARPLHAQLDLAFAFGVEPDTVVDTFPVCTLPPAPAVSSGLTSPLPGIVVLDTCVLLSNILRRVLLRLAVQGCFIPVWSTRIGEEWQRNAARIWGVPRQEVNEQWQALQQAFPFANQGDVSPYEAGLHRSDPKDWHVIAAGRAAKGQYADRTAAVLTRNTKDFNRTELRGYGLSLFDPDELLSRLHAAYPALMQALAHDIPAMTEMPGQEAVSLETLLKRERLFRLNRLYRSLN